MGIDWKGKFFDYLGKILGNAPKPNKLRPKRQATSAESAVMKAFGIKQVVAQWLVDALKQEGYEIKPTPESL
ncbi:MAG: hypothetical protein A4E60_00211 [Syntrophorhabdus sp. PtaB.Bin047]|jgi:hypothetical protein|nr:MAG: hypothetical protein A4E60_00211 [Syntrophorhabdus sp. PtaB.Bin047]